MFKRLNPTTTIALCTGCAIIAFARYEASVTVPAVALCLAAAVICVLPAFYAVLRRKTCRNETPNVD